MANDKENVVSRWIMYVQSVAKILSEFPDVNELEIRKGNFRLRLRRQDAKQRSPNTIGLHVAESPFPTDTQEDLSNCVQVINPFHTPIIFYRSPIKDGPPCVNVGDWVASGERVGVGEVMKIFQDITTEVAGLVRKFVVENGQLVDSGQPIAYVDQNSPKPIQPELVG